MFCLESNKKDHDTKENKNMNKWEKSFDEEEGAGGGGELGLSSMVHRPCEGELQFSGHWQVPG